MVSKAHALVQRPRPKQKPTVKRKDETHIHHSGDANAGADDSPPVNILHLELFHHFTADVITSLGFNKSPFGDSSIDLIKCVLTAPFLMNQILALSALHLSILCPEKQEFYKHHASQLQTHALSGFNSVQMDVTPATCVPMFFFSSILAMHVLSEKLLYRPPTFENFLDDFIHSLRMHRGVRAVTNQSWPLLLETPLKSFLEAEGNALEQATPGTECLELLSFVDAIPFDSAIGNTYRTAAEYLQTAFNGCRKPSPHASAISPMMSWLVTVPPAYIDLLSERRPEALVILSYFAVLLHNHHETWIAGDSGLYLISSINEYLGPSWEFYLRWPNSFLNM